jgi:hypothetical protein
MRSLGLTFFAIFIVIPVISLGQQPPLSQRVVAYYIDAKYDAKSHSLDAVETLTYRNLTGKPLFKFPFHLYLNAFQPGSTFNEESRHRGGFRRGMGGENNKGRGSIDIKQFEVVGMGDGKSRFNFPAPQNLTDKMKFVSPDDGNANDRTVFEVPLPQPIAPGGEVTFRITFHDQFPEVIARTGYKNDFILAGQWFPKVGVWWKGAWNCHQFHLTSEFFADFGTFDVNITLPENFIEGATGAKTAEKKNGDGTRTVTYHAEDVHDFAWTADPKYIVMNDSFTNSAGNKISIRLLTHADHLGSTKRYQQATQGSLKKFDEWYGQYPYSTLTVVDPASGADQAGGMEYPTFITAGTSFGVPDGDLSPELVTEHEFGHQYWYGMVATNEFEDAWLDEGINSYTEAKVMDALYGKRTSVLNFHGATLAEGTSNRISYSRVADLDPMTANAWDYVNAGAYGGTTYSKTALVLLTLEGVIGEEKVQQAIRTWFQRYRFTHPTEEDFMKTVNEVAGQDLTWYWDQAVKGTNVLDYRVMSAVSVNSDPTVRFGRNKKNATYDTTVIVHRKGNFLLPVHLEVKFDNGDVVHDSWDGQARWHRFQWTKNAKLVSAEIDYNHQLLLDTDAFNNSLRAEPDTRATRKLTSYWMILTQWLGQLLSWLA